MGRLRARLGEAVVGVRQVRGRCVMTTFDPTLLEQDITVLQKIYFELDGVTALDCYVVQPGRVRVVTRRRCSTTSRCRGPPERVPRSRALRPQGAPISAAATTIASETPPAARSGAAISAPAGGVACIDVRSSAKTRPRRSAGEHAHADRLRPDRERAEEEALAARAPRQRAAGWASAQAGRAARRRGALRRRSRSRAGAGRPPCPRRASRGAAHIPRRLRGRRRCRRRRAGSCARRPAARLRLRLRRRSRA